MRQRQKPTTNRQSPRNSNDAKISPGNDNLEALRVESSNLLAVADEVINRTLSRDSVVFTDQVRQRGGQ